MAAAQRPLLVQENFTKEGGLPPSGSIRGPYMNTGSRDVGADTSAANPYLLYQREQAREREAAAAAAAAQSATRAR